MEDNQDDILHGEVEWLFYLDNVLVFQFQQGFMSDNEALLFIIAFSEPIFIFF